MKLSRMAKLPTASWCRSGVQVFATASVHGGVYPQDERYIPKGSTRRVPAPWDSCLEVVALALSEKVQRALLRMAETACDERERVLVSKLFRHGYALLGGDVAEQTLAWFRACGLPFRTEPADPWQKVVVIGWS